MHGSDYVAVFHVAVTHSASVSPFTNKPFLSMSETSYQQQQRVNERPGQLLSEFHLLLKRISDSLDPEQVNSLCYVSVEAEKAGIRNREDFSGIVLLDFFHKMMLITPNNLIYLTNQLHAIDRMDLCSLIDQYNARIHSLQRGEIPVEDRPPPYNPEFVSGTYSLNKKICSCSQFDFWYWHIPMSSHVYCIYCT